MPGNICSGRRPFSSEALASLGDTVRVHYKGMFLDGRIFHNTRKSDKGPVEFTLGENKIIPGLENAVLNMRVGEKKTAELPPEDAFGVIRPEVATVPLSDQPPEPDGCGFANVILTRMRASFLPLHMVILFCPWSALFLHFMMSFTSIEV